MPSVYKLQESLQYPWSEDEFAEALVKTNCIGMVAEADGEFVGYMIYELYKGNFYITNLAVVESKRRHKYGTHLVGLLQSRLHPTRRSLLSINVRENDLPTQLFLKSLGFRAKLVKDYYYDEDSYYFWTQVKLVADI